MTFVRTDNDDWDITETVGATALGMAALRARETARADPLFNDPYAQRFVDAAVEIGWDPPRGAASAADTGGQLTGGRDGLANYAVCRTKYFDDFFVQAAHDGIRQMVILGAGLDSRTWRLPWAPGTAVYEIDRPKVLEFKVGTLRDCGAETGAEYRPVPVDLRSDWPEALRGAGFDSSQRSAWSAEGLLIYLPAKARRQLFDCIQRLTTAGSRLAVEAASAAGQTAAGSQRTRDVVGAAGDTFLRDVRRLWYNDQRTYLGDWLKSNGWDITAVESTDLMSRCGRPVAPDAQGVTLRSVFLAGRRM